jgi:hypothetical protein
VKLWQSGGNESGNSIADRCEQKNKLILKISVERFKLLKNREIKIVLLKL